MKVTEMLFFVVVVFERSVLGNAVAVWQVLYKMISLCQAQSEEKECFKASSDTEIIGKPPRAN